MTAPQQQKLRVKGPVMVTANRLRDGVVLYRTAKNWSERLEDAAVVTTAEDALALLHAAEQDGTTAVGAYVASVALDGDAPAPDNLRESIRKNGPTFALPGQ